MEQGWSPLIPVIPFKSSDPPSNDLRHTFASLLLSCNVLLLYVSKQLGHAKPTTTLDHYAKWLPSGEQRFVNVLDTQLEKVGTMSWHQVDITEKEESEVVEKFGGPCRGRTYGPLIKSDKRPFLTKLAIATVSPISFAILMSWSLLFILC